MCKKRIQMKTKMRTFFVQHKAKGAANKNYLLLDNQSMVDQIANPDLLMNIESPRSQLWCIAMQGRQRQTSKAN
jgi:hypothetical protein